jgi:class 3 adenylate cyclase
MSILFAATYPDRVRALVLYGTYAKRMDPDEDYPWAETREVRSAIIEKLFEEWGFESHMRMLAPSADDAMARWWRERSRAAASPGAVRALVQMNSLIDVRAVLPSIHVPTVVVHRTDDARTRLEEGRYIAERIPGARFVEIPGADHFVAVDADQILDVVEPFVAEALDAPPPPRDRVLATILFTDLAGSTELATRLGDAAWADLLARHDRAVRNELGRFAGEEVDNAGDGFLALFDGPSRAVRCGLEIRERLRRLGLDVRIGVHTGEVERAGADVRGVAVHLAARVAAAAAPGELLVSSTTRDLVEGSGLAFEDRGERELKGIERPRRVYAATD